MEICGRSRDGKRLMDTSMLWLIHAAALRGYRMVTAVRVCGGWCVTWIGLLNLADDVDVPLISPTFINLSTRGYHIECERLVI